MKYKIDKNVPVNSLKGSRWDDFNKLLAQMEDGDSVLVEDSKKANRARNFFAWNGDKVVQRLQPDGSYRVWRFKKEQP